MGVPEDVRGQFFREMDPLQDVVHESNVQGAAFPGGEDPSFPGLVMGCRIPGPAPFVFQCVIIQDFPGS